MSKIQIGEADEMVATIKSHWPHFQITRDNVLHPTSDLAVRFYTEFISHCQERLSISIGSSMFMTDSNAELDREETVFQMMSKMSNLFQSAGTTFLLGDVYEPTVVRNKHIFRICMHFIEYYEMILEEVESLGHDISKMKEDGTRLKEHQEHLLVEVNESAMKKVDLINAVQKLSNDLENIKIDHDESMEKKIQAEKNMLEERKKIEMLKCELQKEESDLVALERLEGKLQEQTITENEHNNLLQVLVNLENEIKLLANDDVDMADFLIQENDVLRHYEMCNKRVPDVSDFELKTIEQMIKSENQLYDLKLTIETLMKTKLWPTKQFVSQKMKQQAEIIENVSKSQAQLDLVEKNICSEKEDLLGKARHLKDNNAGKLLECEANISEYNANIIKQASMKDKLAQAFQDEYVRVCDAEKQAIYEFSNWLVENSK